MLYYKYSSIRHLSRWFYMFFNLEELSDKNVYFFTIGLGTAAAALLLTFTQ